MACEVADPLNPGPIDRANQGAFDRAFQSALLDRPGRVSRLMEEIERGGVGGDAGRALDTIPVEPDMAPSVSGGSRRRSPGAPASRVRLPGDPRPEDASWFPPLQPSAYADPGAVAAAEAAAAARKQAGRQRQRPWLTSALDALVGGTFGGLAASAASGTSSGSGARPTATVAAGTRAPAADAGCSPRPLHGPEDVVVLRGGGPLGGSSWQPKATSRQALETGELVVDCDEPFPPRFKPSEEELRNVGLGGGGPLGWSTDQPILGSVVPLRQQQQQQQQSSFQAARGAVAMQEVQQALAALPDEGPSHGAHDQVRSRASSPASRRGGSPPRTASPSGTRTPRSRPTSPQALSPAGAPGERAAAALEAPPLESLGCGGPGAEEPLGLAEGAEGALADSEDWEDEDGDWDGSDLPWPNYFPQVHVVKTGLASPPVDLGWDCEAEIDRLVAERLEGTLTDRLQAKSMQKRAEYVENTTMGRVEEFVRGGGWAMLESIRQSADVLLGRVTCAPSGPCNRCVSKVVPITVYCDGDENEEDHWSGLVASAKTQGDPYAPLDTGEVWTPRQNMSPEASGGEETPKGKAKGKGKKGKGKGKPGDDAASSLSAAGSMTSSAAMLLSGKGAGKPMGPQDSKGKGKGKSQEEIGAMVAKAKGKGKSPQEIDQLVAWAKGKGKSSEDLGKGKGKSSESLGKGKGPAEEKGMGKGKSKGSPPETPRSEADSAKGKGKDKGKGKAGKGKGKVPESPRSDAESAKSKGKGKSAEDLAALLAKGKGKGKDGAAKGKGKEDGQSVLGSSAGLSSAAASALGSLKGAKGKGKDGKGKGDAGKGKGKSKGKPGPGA